MGTPKLLLELGGQTVLARLLTALGEGGVQNRFVVLHPEDVQVRAEVEQHGGTPLVPDSPPPEMRASVAFGLSQIRQRSEARSEIVRPDDPWLLVPADHPVLSAGIVNTLLDAARNSRGGIVIPTFRGQPGHPTLFAWKHALEVDQIPADRGFNWLVQQHATDVIYLPVDDEGVLLDLDTPEDYERLKSKWRA